MRLLITLQISFLSIISNISVAANRFEVIPPGEAQMIDGLAENIRKGIERSRDAHAKANGCIGGATVTIDKNLPQDLQVGVFIPGERYDAILRSSNGSGDPKVADKTGGAQGLALKILLEGKEIQQRMRPLAGEQMFADKRYYQTQDILGINRVSEFFVNNTPDYIEFFKAQGAAGAAAAKAKAEGKSEEEINKIRQATFAKIFVTPEGRAPRLQEAQVLQKLAAIRTLDPLVEEFNSMVPSLFGEDRAVKYRMSPCEKSTSLPVVSEAEMASNPNFLRDTLKSHLNSQDTCYKLLVQFHVESMPSVEQASAVWSTKLSDYVEVATITVPQKEKGKELMDDELCETISFTPWHTLPEHMPIGGVQRAREKIYVTIANQRNLNKRR